MQEREQLYRIFSLIDTDGSGTLELSEVQAAMHNERSLRALLRASPRFCVARRRLRRLVGWGE